MKSTTLLTAVPSALVVLASSASAQNDECSTAAPLALGSVAFDTTLATLSPEPWPCAGGGGPDLWYAHTATSTNPVRFDTCSMANYDTALEAFTGDCTTLVPVVCNDDACGLSSVVTVVPSVVGEVIYVRVGGFNGSAGQGTLTATELTPIPNDECSTATPVGLGATPFDVLGATASPEPWACFPSLAFPDAWYAYTATSGDVLRIDVTPTNITGIEAFSGTCGALTSLACGLAGPFPGNTPIVVRPSGAGDVIHLRFGDLTLGGTDGSFTVEELDPAVNDDCSGAIALVPGVPTPFQTLSATPSSGSFTCATGVGPDVWFSYTAADPNVTLRVETCGSLLDTVLEAYEGSCGSLVPLACSDDVSLCGSGLQSRVSVVNPVPGQTYSFRVAGALGMVGDGEILLQEVPPPVQGCVVNPGFESQDVAGWTLRDFATPFFPATVAPAGVDVGFGFFASDPSEGSFSFVHGFDADGPDTLVLAQEVTVDPLLTPLTFDWRAGWDMQSFPGSTMDRKFEVVVRDPGTGGVLQRTTVLTAAAGTSVSDTGTGQAVVDLASFVGQTVELSFEWIVPEAFTGPAFFELDNVLCPDQGGGIGIKYCTPANPNSTGEAGSIQAFGSPVASANMVTLVAENLPQNSFGFFLTSETRGFVFNPGGSFGNLCLGGDIGRYFEVGQIQNTGSGGEIMLTLDLTMTPQPTGFVPILAGETWNFQGWYRDSIGGTAVSNLTDGVTVDFL